MDHNQQEFKKLSSNIKAVDTMGKLKEISTGYPRQITRH